MPWLADYKHPNYVAAAEAIQLVYETEPDFIREGGSIPITLTFQVSVCHLSFKAQFKFMQVYMIGRGIPPYCANPYHPAFSAARQSIVWAHGELPCMTRLGSSLKRINFIQVPSCTSNISPSSSHFPCFSLC